MGNKSIPHFMSSRGRAWNQQLLLLHAAAVADVECTHLVSAWMSPPRKLSSQRRIVVTTTLLWCSEWVKRQYRKLSMTDTSSQSLCKQMNVSWWKQIIKHSHRSLNNAGHLSLKMATAGLRVTLRLENVLDIFSVIIFALFFLISSINSSLFSNASSSSPIGCGGR